MTIDESNNFMTSDWQIVEDVRQEKAIEKASKVVSSAVIIQNYLKKKKVIQKKKRILYIHLLY